MLQEQSSLLDGYGGPASEPRFREDCGCGRTCGPCSANFGLGLQEPDQGRQLDGTMGAHAAEEDEPFWTDGYGAPAGDPFDGRVALPRINVDIYFSAGPRSHGAPFGCASGVFDKVEPVQARCSLYRVSIGGGTATVTRIRNYMDELVDYVMPTVDSDGEHLAYAVRRFGREEQGGIEATNVFTYTDSTVLASSSGPLQFPVWYDSDSSSTEYLMWSYVARPGASGGAEDTENGIAMAGYKGAGWVDPPATPIMGPGTMVTQRREVGTSDYENADFADPEVRPADAPADSERNVVTHSMSLDDGKNLTFPIVFKLTIAGTVSYEDFYLGNRPSDNTPIEQCHHPSWGSSGEIMCWDRYKDPQHVRGVIVQGSYVYERSPADSTWRPDGRSYTGDIQANPAFPFPTGAQLRAEMPEVFERAFESDDRVRSTSFKHSCFTPRSDYVVTALMVGDTDDFKGANNGFTRVILVRRSNGRFWDLTRLVEAHHGATAGSWGATWPTVSRARGQ